MMHRLFLVLLLAAAAAGVPTPAQAAACSGSTGVTVVVDYDDGRTRVGCAPGDPSSGYEALQAAGFDITYVQPPNGAALCSIDSVPRRVCPSMPPADAYWAYFHAERGGSWRYSNLGGAAYDPQPGSVEGWHFRGSSGNPPSVAPPAAPSTPKPSPKPSPKPKPQPVTKPTSPAAPGTPTVVPDATATNSTATPTASQSVAAATDAPADLATDATDPADDDAVAAASTTPPAASDDSGGASWVWGVAVVAVLSAVAGGLVLRRRQRV